MDLSRLETVKLAESGVWFEPLDFEGEPCGLEILVHGTDSKEFRRKIAERAAKTVTDRIEKKAGAKVEEVDERAISVADATMDWRWKDVGDPPEPATFNGEQPAFSHAMAVTLYAALPFIADQVDRFIGRRKNFTKPVSPS